MRQKFTTAERHFYGQLCRELHLRVLTYAESFLAMCEMRSSTRRE